MLFDMRVLTRSPMKRQTITNFRFFRVSYATLRQKISEMLPFQEAKLKICCEILNEQQYSFLNKLFKQTKSVSGCQFIPRAK